MAVRSRKYSPHINNDARKYILCAEIFVQCAGKLVTPHIYIIYAPKHLYKCANILTCAEILSLCAETNSLCAETHLLCMEIYVLRGNLFTVHGNSCAVRKYFQVPANFLVCVRKLLCPMRGFSASNHFRNAAMPWLANWSIVGSFSTLGGVSNSPILMHQSYPSYLGYLHRWGHQWIQIWKIIPIPVTFETDPRTWFSGVN